MITAQLAHTLPVRCSLLFSHRIVHLHFAKITLIIFHTTSEMTARKIYLFLSPVLFHVSWLNFIIDWSSLLLLLLLLTFSCWHSSDDFVYLSITPNTNGPEIIDAPKERIFSLVFEICNVIVQVKMNTKPVRNDDDLHARQISIPPIVYLCKMHTSHTI